MSPCACRRAIKRLHGFERKRKSKNTHPSASLALAMLDDDDKPEPVRFPVVVTVNGVRVEVVLMLRPGATVTQERAAPEPPKSP
jgi:hypothetical protein